MNDSEGGQMNGTDWVDRGKGAMVRTLLYLVAEQGSGKGAGDAALRLSQLAARRGIEHQTNIEITGNSLTEYDLRRLAACE